MQAPGTVKDDEIYINISGSAVLILIISVHDVSNSVMDQWTAFQNLEPTLSTMQPSNWVTSLEDIYQIMRSFLWSHKRLHITLFHIYSSTSQDLQTHFNV